MYCGNQQKYPSSGLLANVMFYDRLAGIESPSLPRYYPIGWGDNRIGGIEKQNRTGNVIRVECTKYNYIHICATCQILK